MTFAHLRPVRLVVYALAACAMTACQPGNTTTYGSSVPNTPVNFELRIQGQYATFVPAGDIKMYTFTQPQFPTQMMGYAGLLVCTTFNETYAAFDLCCPHCVSKRATVEPDGMFAHCPNCGEDYDISYGLATPTQGISRERLKEYHCYYDYARGTLLIRN